MSVSKKVHFGKGTAPQWYGNETRPAQEANHFPSAELEWSPSIYGDPLCLEAGMLRSRVAHTMYEF